MAPKQSAEVPSMAPKPEKAVMRLTEGNTVPEKFRSRMSYSVVGHEHNVNKSQFILNKIFYVFYKYNTYDINIT